MMPLTIFLVEDNNTTQKMVELTFDSFDATIVVSQKGEEAFLKIKDEIPDIVIADADISGKSGFELADQIKNDPDLNIIPLILLVSNDFEIDKDERYKKNAEGLLYKPFKSDELIAMVDEFTGLNSMQSDRKDDRGKKEKKQYSDVVTLQPEDEIEEAHISKNGLRGQDEILPEDILEEKEKEIDFSDFTSDEMVINEESSVHTDESVNSNSNTSIELKEEVLKKNESSIDYSYEPKDASGEASSPKHPFKKQAEDITEGVDKDLNKAVLNKLLGEQLQSVIENILKDVTKDVLKTAVEKSVTDALENSFEKFSPRIVKIIEDIAWEIIPDLSEVLIKKEIEKLKSGL